MFKFGLSSREVDILSRTLAEVQELRMEISNLREQLDKVKSTASMSAEDIIDDSNTGATTQDAKEDCGLEGPGVENTGVDNGVLIPGPVERECLFESHGSVTAAECQNGEQAPEACNNPGDNHDEKTVIKLVIGNVKDMQPAGETQEMPASDLKEAETVNPAGEKTASTAGEEIESQSPDADPLSASEPEVNQAAAAEVGENEPLAARIEPGLTLPAAAGDWAVVNVPPRSNPWWRFWGKKTGIGKSV